MSATDDESRIPSFPDTVHTLEALYDFQSFDPGDLSCSAGDVVNVLRRNSNGWWNVRRINDDAIGVVPTNYFVSTRNQNVRHLLLIRSITETSRSTSAVCI